jgi:hypothetical protein
VNTKYVGLWVEGPKGRARVVSHDEPRQTKGEHYDMTSINATLDDGSAVELVFHSMQYMLASVSP